MFRAFRPAKSSNQLQKCSSESKWNSWQRQWFNSWNKGYKFLLTCDRTFEAILHGPHAVWTHENLWDLVFLELSRGSFARPPCHSSIRKKIEHNNSIHSSQALTHATGSAFPRLQWGAAKDVLCTTTSHLCPSARRRRSRQSIQPPGSHLPDATWWPGWGRGVATPAWCTSSPWDWAGRRSGRWPPSRCSAALDSAEETQREATMTQRTVAEVTMEGHWQISGGPDWTDSPCGVWVFLKPLCLEQCLTLVHCRVNGFNRLVRAIVYYRIPSNERRKGFCPLKQALNLKWILFRHMNSVLRAHCRCSVDQLVAASRFKSYQTQKHMCDRSL